MLKIMNDVYYLTCFESYVFRRRWDLFLFNYLPGDYVPW
jgi:hypothetical protein